MPAPDPHRPEPTARRLRSGLALALLATMGLALAVAAFRLLPLEEGVMAVTAALRGYGAAGAVAFVALAVAAMLLCIPASGFALAAGLIYGLWGVPLMWTAMMVAAALSFPLARRVLADRVRGWIAGSRALRLALEVVEEDGGWMVLLLRISGFIPFGVQNYAIGLTRIGYRPYLVATAFGIAPSITVYGGSAALGGAALEGGLGDPVRAVPLALAVLAALTLVIWTGRRIRTRLAAQPRPG